MSVSEIITWNGSGAPQAADHVHKLWQGSHDEWDEIEGCRRCGIGLLDLIFRANLWINRRVEGITFVDERTVRRRVSVDLRVPDVAPILFSGEDAGRRILPVACMRRKSLLNFDLRDISNQSIPLLGLRETQAFTTAMLLGWAAARLDLAGGTDLDSECRRLLTKIVKGNHKEHAAAWGQWTERAAPSASDGSGTSHLDVLRRDASFQPVFDRIARQFVLFVPVETVHGDQTIMKYAYDEPLTLRYRMSGYTGRTESDEPTYDELPKELSPFHPKQLWASVGWTPTRIRFPVPSAESCASFHVEVTAPPDSTISDASVLAGRPNVTRSDANQDEDPNGRSHPFGGISFDHVRGGFRNVDLHVADVPYGSLCRAQVHLSVPVSGWLATTFSTMFASSLLVTGVTVWANSHQGRTADNTTHQAVAALLATFAIGLIALFSQPIRHKMAAKLLSGVRGMAIATALIALTVGMAVDFRWEHSPLWALTIVSWLLTVAIFGSLVASYWNCRERRKIESPWEQVPEQPAEIAEPEPKADSPETLFEAWQRRYRFDKPAIRVASAEGSRRSFPWDDEFAARFDHEVQQAKTWAAQIDARRGPDSAT